VKRAVLLDRDGTIIVRKTYLSDPDEVELIPGAAAALRALSSRGLPLLVVSNQSAIGRGYFDAERLHQINERMMALLRVENVALSGIYVCPHTPEDCCECRKPAPGLVRQAAAEHDFDPRAGFVIGDNRCDVDLGRAVGATTFLVATGHGSEFVNDDSIRPDYRVADIGDASRIILELMSRDDAIRDYLATSAQLLTRAASECAAQIGTAAEAIIAAYRAGGKVLLCGNGGSAADCQHIATELMSRLHKEVERRALPAIALTTDTSFLTAFTNDCGYDGVFARQVESLGAAGDVLIAISTSGRSPNVLRAAEAATAKRMTTIGITGTEGPLREKVDIAVSIPSGDTQHIQETGLAIEHLICQLVEDALFPPHRSRPGEE